MIYLVSFTLGGKKLSDRLKQLWPNEMIQHIRGGEMNMPPLSEFTREAMASAQAIIFIGATGIAVRAIAPYLKSKAMDPAVLVMDEKGQFVIPLLSGHLGGGNALSTKIAQAIGATAVLTTATDVCGVFAIDVWAKQRAYEIAELKNVRYISSALLRSEAVGFQSDFPIATPLPNGMVSSGEPACGAVLSYWAKTNPFPCTLHIIPQNVTVGIGCRKNKSMEQMESVLEEALYDAKIDRRALQKIVSIDLKKEEQGLLQLAEKWNLPLSFYTADALSQVAGNFTSSAFVKEITGVDNVCERAAILSTNGQILQSKFAKDGVTIAFAARHLEVTFS